MIVSIYFSYLNMVLIILWNFEFEFSDRVLYLISNINRCHRNYLFL